jgi:DNA repair exonuclease SbcCD ATPase subunit
MQLISLKMKNFKGLSNYTFQPDGKNVTVRGDNATGKSTLADAFFWLLVGKDSHNKKDFEIKPLDSYNQPLHGLDYEVEAVIITSAPGIERITLKKCYRENWTKKRGKAEATFSGHTIDHSINGVPCKAGEFDAKVKDIAPEETLRLLTDPRHFNVNLHWQDRRKLLLEVCGDVTDAEVIDSNAQLSKLKAILQGRKADDHKTIILGRQKEIQKELDRIPTRIDEVSFGLPDISEINRTAHEANIKALQAEIEKLEQKKQQAKSGSGAAELENQIAIVTAKMQNLVNRLNEEYQKEREPKQKEARKLCMDIEDLKATINRHQRSLDVEQASLESKQQTITSLQEEIKEVAGEELELSVKEVCPTCGQSLPTEKVEAARDDALKRFNQQKVNQLTDLKAKEDAFKKGVKDSKAFIKSFKEDITQAEATIKELELKLKPLEKGLEKEVKDPTESAVYKELDKERDKLIDELNALKESKSGDTSASDAKIAEVKEEIRQSEKILLQLDQHEKGKKRIQELKDEERKLAAEYEELEQEVFLIEEFTRAKVKLLDDKINSRFTHARFKLFKEYIGGGIDEVCICLYNGIPYDAGLNAGHQTIVGLDIISTLADHYKLYPPVFIDNAEAITDLPEMKQQVIKLIKPEIKNEKDRAKYQKLIMEVI